VLVFEAGGFLAGAGAGAGALPDDEPPELLEPLEPLELPELVQPLELDELL
jgi:hypothetical protein